MKKFLSAIFATLIAFSLFSCKEEDDDEVVVPSTCTVTVYANGGTMTSGDEGSTEKKTYTVSYGKIFYIDSAETLGLSKSNSIFLGWAESQTASSAEYQSEMPYKIYSNINFYAVWQKLSTQEYYISSNGNDNSGTGSKTKPFATLNKALEKTGSRYADYTFYVSGALKSETISIVDSSSKIANSITIQGSSESADSISVSDSSSIFVINSAAKILISNLTLSGGKGFLSNGKKFGGAVYIYGDKTNVEFSSVTFKENSADYGGAVYISNATVNFSNCMISENKAEQGAGVYNFGNTEFSKSTISSNEATDCAGGVYNAQKVDFIETSSISNNKAKKGAGVYNKGTFNLKSKISENTASELGGGVYNEGVFIANSGIVNDNVVSSENAMGTGIYNKGRVSLSGANVKSHNAKYGAALYNDEGGTATLSNGTISENNAENGGAFYNAGEFIIEGGEISENSATSFGGALYNIGRLSITKCSIMSNKAQSGGAIAISGSNATCDFAYGTVSLNNAENGGAFFIDGGASLVLSDSSEYGYGEIIDNIASLYGGGLYIKSGTLAVNKGIISSYGKRKIDKASYFYSGNKAGENKSTSSNIEEYSGCGNSWFCEKGTVTAGNSTLTRSYSDEDIVVGVSNWQGLVTE